MLLTRHDQACVEIATASTRIVIDPGDLGEPVDFRGIDAVFVTHDHFDHVSHRLLEAEFARRSQLQQIPLHVFGPASFVKVATFPVTAMADGDSNTVGDISVAAVGRWQEPGSLNEPQIENIGYVIDGRILHPGDAYQLVDDIEVLLLPMAAPWIRVTEQERYLRKVRPKILVGIHDIELGELGRSFAEKTLHGFAEDIQALAVWLEPGRMLTV